MRYALRAAAAMGLFVAGTVLILFPRNAQCRTLSEDQQKTVSDQEISKKIKPMLGPWLRYWVTYDTRPALEKVKCPVLALNGSNDLQVPAKQNLPEIEKALEAGGNTDHEIAEIPGLNHLFQTCKTGLPAEYPGIAKTISPLALKTIEAWIQLSRKTTRQPR